MHFMYTLPLWASDFPISQPPNPDIYKDTQPSLDLRKCKSRSRMVVKSAREFGVEIITIGSPHHHVEPHEWRVR
jgi:hypothetical protein